MANFEFCKEKVRNWVRENFRPFAIWIVGKSFSSHLAYRVHFAFKDFPQPSARWRLTQNSPYLVDTANHKFPPLRRSRHAIFCHSQTHPFTCFSGISGLEKNQYTFKKSLKLGIDKIFELCKYNQSNFIRWL